MVVAYLSSEIPSTSATFVYREILEVEKQGHRIVPFTLRRARHLAVEPSAQALAGRVTVVYERPFFALLCAVAQIAMHPLATLYALGTLLSDAMSVSSFSWPKLCFKFAASLALARNLREAGCGHLHVHFAHAPATVGMYAALAAGIPFSVTAHANDIYEHAELLGPKIKRARPFITISEFNRRYLLNLFPGARIEIVRCGIGAEAAAPGFQPVARVPGEPLHVVALGRLVPKKGFDVLLRALAELEATSLPWRCSLGGDGPEEERLRTLAVELKLPASKLRFLGGLAPRDVPDLLNSGDIFVLPCRQDAAGDVDGIPVVLMEAMALGIPCVSTQLSGIPELIADGDTGSLVAPDDATALADALRMIAESPERAQQMAQRGRAFVWREFSRERNAACLSSLWTAAVVSNRDDCAEINGRKRENNDHSKNCDYLSGSK